MVYINANVLGQRYDIEIRKESDDPKLEHCGGYCDWTTHTIVIGAADENDPLTVGNVKAEYDRIIRHELTHAFIVESGLADESAWATNEEMVDWIARQFPKMLRAFREVGAISSELNSEK